MYPLIPEFMWPYTVWVFLAGAIAFAIAIAHRLLNAIKLFRLRRNLYRAYDNVVNAIGHCYFAGVCLKFSGFGPDWLRWWMGDFGFPVAIALIFLSFVERHVHINVDELSMTEWINNRIIYVKLGLTKVLPVTFTLSVSYEIFCGFLQATGERNGVTLGSFGIGGFDPVDVLMYFLGSSLAAISWLMCLRLLKKGRDAHHKANELASRKKAEEKARAGTGARKYSNKKRRTR